MKLDTHRKPIEKRIQTFERRFGQKHLIFAYHAAFPLALTPDLLQCLWANFRCDTRGEVLDIPWVAVNDFLLSGLCEEVGEELYEMDAEIRDLLLEQLQGEENFQQKRIQELSSFLLAYADPWLDTADRDLRDFAQAQRWTALAYSQPEKAARELALELSKTYQNEENRDDIIRISESVETLKNPLAEFEQLLNYARGMVNLVRGNTETALNYFENSGQINGIVRIAGVECIIPQYVGTEEVQANKEKPLISLSLLHFLIFLIFVLIGGWGLWIYFMRFSLTSKIAKTVNIPIPSEQSSPHSTETIPDFPPIKNSDSDLSNMPIDESPQPSFNTVPDLPELNLEDTNPRVNNIGDLFPSSRENIESIPDEKNANSNISESPSQDIENSGTSAAETPGEIHLDISPNIQLSPNNDFPESPLPESLNPSELLPELLNPPDLSTNSTPSCSEPIVIPEMSPVMPFIQAFEFVGNTIFSNNRLNQELAAYKNADLNFEQLNQAAECIQALYHNNGYLASIAFVPNQSLDEIAIIEIVEGTVPEIEINIQGDLAPEYILSRLEPAITVPLHIPSLDEALRNLLQDPLIESLDPTLTVMRDGTSILSVDVTTSEGSAR